jgi:hypothetical protein
VHEVRIGPSTRPDKAGLAQDLRFATRIGSNRVSGMTPHQNCGKSRFSRWMATARSISTTLRC